MKKVLIDNLIDTLFSDLACNYIFIITSVIIDDDLTPQAYNWKIANHFNH